MVLSKARWIFTKICLVRLYLDLMDQVGHEPNVFRKTDNRSETTDKSVQTTILLLLLLDNCYYLPSTHGVPEYGVRTRARVLSGRTSVGQWNTGIFIAVIVDGPQTVPVEFHYGSETVTVTKLSRPPAFPEFVFMRTFHFPTMSMSLWSMLNRFGTE